MDKPMPALSIRQPWAQMIVTGEKNVENRDWSTGFRGRIYVHAGKIPDGPMSEIPSYIAASQFGAIVGEVDIVDCVTQSDLNSFQGPYGFLLANPVAYETPIPCRGRLGFWKPDI